MEELKLGIVKTKELAEWFHIAPTSLSNQKKKKLEELRTYCEFEDLGRKGVNIIEIYNPLYQTKAKQKIKEIFDELFEKGELISWGEDESNFDTAVHFAHKIIEKYGDFGIKFPTLVKYIQQEKKDRYGKNSTRAVRQKPGKEGSARYVFCKLTAEGCYLDFTEKEKEIKRKLYKELNIGESIEDFEDFQAIKEAYERNEINAEEYADYCSACRQERWQKYLGALEEKLGCRCVFATHLKKGLEQAE